MRYIEHNNYLRILILQGILLLCVIPPLYGAEGVPLRLEECLEMVFSSNRTISITEQEMEAADARVLTARSVFFPQLSFESSVSRIDRLSQFQIPFGTVPRQITIGTRDMYSANLSLQYPVFTWGANRNSYSLSEYSRELTGEKTEGKRKELYDRTVRVFYELLLRQHVEDIFRKSVRDALELEELARVRFEEGIVLKLDLLNASLNLTGAKSGLEDAQEARNRARMSLNRLLERELLSPLEISGDFIERENKNSSEGLVESALRTRNELRELNIQEEMTAVRMKIVKNALRPNVYASAGYNYRNGYLPEVTKVLDNWNVGLVVSFPLFDGMSSRYRVQQEKINQKILSLQREEITDRISLEIEELNSRLRQLSTTLVYEKQRVVLAEEAYTVAVAQYENGMTAMMDVLEAEEKLRMARLKNLQVQFSFTVAYYDLQKAAGIYPDFVISGDGGGK